MVSRLTFEAKLTWNLLLRRRRRCYTNPQVLASCQHRAPALCTQPVSILHPTGRPCSWLGCAAAQLLPDLPPVGPAAEFLALNLQVTSLCFILSCSLWTAAQGPAVSVRRQRRLGHLVSAGQRRGPRSRLWSLNLSVPVLTLRSPAFMVGDSCLSALPSLWWQEKQNTLHGTGGLVCQAPACSWSSSSSKMLFYSCLHPFLKTVGSCPLSLMLQPSHLPHLKRFQQPQGMLAYQLHLFKDILCSAISYLCYMTCSKPFVHFLPPCPSLWATHGLEHLWALTCTKAPWQDRSWMLGTALGPHLRRQCQLEPSHTAEHTSVVYPLCTSAQRLLLVLQTRASENQPGHQSHQQRHLPCAVSEHNAVAVSAPGRRCFPAAVYHSSERFSSYDSCQTPPGVQAASNKPLLGKQTWADKNWERPLHRSHISVCKCLRHLHIPPATELFMCYFTTEVWFCRQCPCYLTTRSEWLAEANNCLMRHIPPWHPLLHLWKL